ncbi:MAG: hypothetical protein VKJ24_16110, partial [Synechococcales bacterium]|nr:hypothetical protein [Synechococcales bacterium]
MSSKNGVYQAVVAPLGLIPSGLIGKVQLAQVWEQRPEQRQRIGWSGLRGNRCPGALLQVGVLGFLGGLLAGWGSIAAAEGLPSSLIGVQPSIVPRSSEINPFESNPEVVTTEVVTTETLPYQLAQFTTVAELSDVQPT